MEVLEFISCFFATKLLIRHRILKYPQYFGLKPVFDCAGGRNVAAPEIACMAKRGRMIIIVASNLQRINCRHKLILLEIFDFPINFA